VADALKLIETPQSAKLTDNLIEVLKIIDQPALEPSLKAFEDVADTNLRQRINTAVKANRGDLPFWRKNPVTDFFSPIEKHIISIYEIQDAMLETLPKFGRGSKEYKSLIEEMAMRPNATLEAIEITVRGWIKSGNWPENNIARANIMLDVLEYLDGGKAVDILKMIVDNGPAELLTRATTMHEVKRDALIEWLQGMGQQNASAL